MAGPIPEQVFWIGDDAGLPYEHETNRLEAHAQLIGVYKGEVGDCKEYIPACYQEKQFTALQEKTSGSWVYIGECKDKRVHQALVVASQLRKEPSYRSWKDFAKEVKPKSKKRPASAGIKKTQKSAGQKMATRRAEKLEKQMLFMFTWTGIPNVSNIEEVYANATQMYEESRCYPNLTELRESELKIGDIQALDIIAAKATDRVNKYRPKTCFKPEPKCELAKPDVMKQTNSACSEGVIINPKKEHRPLLQCYGGILDEAIEKRFVKNDASWFHQEKVNPLRDLGEFRVLIATVPDKDGLRGRTGYVYEVIHTAQHKTGQATVKRTLSKIGPELLGPHCGKRTYGELETFTLWVFDQLRAFEHQDIVGTNRDDIKIDDAKKAGTKRKRDSDEEEGSAQDVASPSKKSRHNSTESRPDQTSDAVETSNADKKLSANDDPEDGSPDSSADCSESMFESLECGVRMDIGISTEEEGYRFFVNEISREWYVDYFSFVHGRPQTRYCTALANARSNYFFGPEVEQADSSDGAPGASGS